ncbi:UPF0301 protein Sde_3637 [Geodia barretti]|uniref:UPF0301 protein Sde_3637 n=1 Tax=Geodia barretti TaxID=519541 RepID=A0AA35SEZ5_GEOBA|nr:UPF0301 protein Sde_3637 [Geodia barretti]
MPGLPDSRFRQTVTYLCGHNSDGALGIVINRPSKMKLGEVFEQLSLDNRDLDSGQSELLKGGPVNRERGFVLHEAGGTWDSTISICGNIEVTTSRDVLSAIAGRTGPRRALLALGCAGWGEGQLEQELHSNSWMVVDATEEILFETPFEQRWAASAALLGVDVARLGLHAGHA